MTNIPVDRRKRTFGKTIQNFKTPHFRCYAPGDTCKGKPIRAHSVQNASILDSIQENGHVYVPRIQLTFDDAKIAFNLVGRNLATTFHGLCNEHDTEIFRPIETNALDINSEEHLFLLAYRAVLKETHSTAKSAIDTQASYIAGVDEGLFPESICAPGMLAAEHMRLAYMVHMQKVRFDYVYTRNNYSDLKHYIFDLKSKPSLAANSFLSTGRFCLETDSLAFATLNILPLADTTYMIISCLNDHDSALRQSFLKFFRSGNLQENVSYLVLKRCENFALRPSTFDNFSEEKKAICQEFYFRNMGSQSYEPSNRKLLNLFQRANGA